tara:strand:- start:392 stop:592 length:201 start_codon:yes stop_codon:yes gene_type:complete
VDLVHQVLKHVQLVVVEVELLRLVQILVEVVDQELEEYLQLVEVVQVLQTTLQGQHFHTLEVVEEV